MNARFRYSEPTDFFGQGLRIELMVQNVWDPADRMVAAIQWPTGIEVTGNPSWDGPADVGNFTLEVVARASAPGRYEFRGYVEHMDQRINGRAGAASRMVVNGSSEGATVELLRAPDLLVVGISPSTRQSNVGEIAVYTPGATAIDVGFYNARIAEGSNWTTNIGAGNTTLEFTVNGTGEPNGSRVLTVRLLPDAAFDMGQYRVQLDVTFQDGQATLSRHRLGPAPGESAGTNSTDAPPGPVTTAQTSCGPNC